MRPMRFYLIVRSAQRRIVCRNSGAITLVDANITQPPTWEGSATATPDDAWATDVAVFSKWPLPQANLLPLCFETRRCVARIDGWDNGPKSIRLSLLRLSTICTANSGDSRRQRIKRRINHPRRALAAFFRLIKR